MTFQKMKLLKVPIYEDKKTWLPSTKGFLLQPYLTEWTAE